MKPVAQAAAATAGVVVLLVGGGSVVRAVSSPDVAPAGCVEGDTVTVCTVPKSYITETAVVTTTATSTVTATATQTVTATASSTPSPSLTPTSSATASASPTATATATATVTPAAAPAIGMSAPQNLWDERKAQVEATGGKLQARRIFLQGFDSSLTLVQSALSEGLLPVVSFKPGDWGNVAAGQSDAAIRSLAIRLAALNKPIVVAVHHEPDSKSTPADVGEGGTAAEFAAMQVRVEGLLDAAPNVQFAVIMNGWWWDGSSGALTDAQINVWLPQALRAQLDVVAADDYSPEGGGNPAVVKAQNRAAWARRVGDVKALGTGETNAFTAKELTDVFTYAKTEPLFRGGWILVWNAQGSTYRPLTETGLLDDFQTILRDW